MITCPICGASNEDYSFRCTRCHSYLQNRVPNIDLFSTLWGLIEHPNASFHTIAVAEHKNYSILLFSLLGIILTFSTFAFLRLGNSFDNLINLLSVIILRGIITGIALSIILSLLHALLAKFSIRRTTLRNALALLAFAFAPYCLISLILMPIKLQAFGMYYFTSNPPPAILNPLLYYILQFFDGASFGWSFYLAIIGSKITYQISITRSIFINFFTFIIALGIVYYSYMLMY